MTDLPDSTRWQLWIVAFGFFMQSLDHRHHEREHHLRARAVPFVLLGLVGIGEVLLAEVGDDAQLVAVVAQPDAGEVVARRWSLPVTGCAPSIG